MTKQTWAKCWALLSAIYPQAKQIANEHSMEAYYMVLEEYFDHEVQAAVKQHMKTSKWFPEPADLIGPIASHRGHLGHSWDQVHAALLIEAGGEPVEAIEAAEVDPSEYKTLAEVLGPVVNKIGLIPKKATKDTNES